MGLGSYLVVLALCSIAMGQSFTGPGFSTYRYTAELTPSQVPNQCAAALAFRGAGSCTLDRGARPRPVIDCEVVHNVEDFSVGTIEIGFAGSSGIDVLHQFIEQELYGFFDGEIMRATFTLDEDDDEEQELAFLSGDVFVLVTSDACPGGAIRGAFTADFNVFADLRGANEVPPIASPEQGYAVAKYDLGTRQLTSFIDHTVKDPTGAHIHEASEGVNGDIIFPFTDPETQIVGTVSLTEAQEATLFDQGLYYNIHSPLFTSGEIRDQLRVIDAIPRANYAFQLTSQAVVPPSGAQAVGAAIFAVNCVTFEVEYMVTHNVADATAVTLEFGSEDDNGDFIIELNGERSPVFGSFVASDNLYINLVNGNLFVQVYSQQFNEGAIRGQVEASVPYFAYLSGYQENPAVTTAAKGIALMDLEGDDVEYFVQHTVDSSTAAHFHLSSIGVNGDIITEIGQSGDSPIQGAASLGSSDEDAFRAGDVYINVHSISFPTGEIRGQVLRSTAVCTQFPGYFSSSYYSRSSSSNSSPSGSSPSGSSTSSSSSSSSSDASALVASAMTLIGAAILIL